MTQNTTLITEGMGCGSVCDTQYLFSCDVLGTNRGHYPRHSKTYANLAAEVDRLEAMRYLVSGYTIGNCDQEAVSAEVDRLEAIPIRSLYPTTADLEAEEDRLQAMRIEAFRNFMDEAKSGAYPELCHEIHVTDESVLEALQRAKQT